LNILIEILNKNGFPCNNLDEEFIKEEIIDITKIPPPLLLKSIKEHK